MTFYPNLKCPLPVFTLASFTITRHKRPKVKAPGLSAGTDQKSNQTTIPRITDNHEGERYGTIPPPIVQTAQDVRNT